MKEPCWVVTAICCPHCGVAIYSHNTLRDSIDRSALLKGAKDRGAVQRGEYWFCGRACRTAHEINPGLPSNTKSWPINLD
jgi:hypothetical protein